MQVLKLQRPSKLVHDAFRSYFRNLDKAKAFPKLAGLNETLYDDRHDLISLAQYRDDDRLTTFLRERHPELFRRSTTEMAKNVGSLSEDRLRAFVGIVNLLTASAMLFGAIYALHYEKNVEKRLALVASFTIAFALCIGLLTNARRPEIFAACAAYAAVLVVFVSGDLHS